MDWPELNLLGQATWSEVTDTTNVSNTVLRKPNTAAPPATVILGTHEVTRGDSRRCLVETRF